MKAAASTVTIPAVPVTVRALEPQDQPAWLAMRTALWPETPPHAHEEEVRRFFAGTLLPGAAVLLAEDARSGPVGFVELSLRSWAAGCVTDGVAYLEGWYVVPSARRTGVGRALVEAAEAWARARGCTEFASDAEPGNATSHAAHRALGFADAGVLVCFRKDL